MTQLFKTQKGLVKAPGTGLLASATEPSMLLILLPPDRVCEWTTAQTHGDAGPVLCRS